MLLKRKLGRLSPGTNRVKMGMLRTNEKDSNKYSTLLLGQFWYLNLKKEPQWVTEWENVLGQGVI